MEVKFKNGVTLDCTPQEFNLLHLGETALPIKVELLSKVSRTRGKYRKRRRRRKNTFSHLQRVLHPVFGTARGKNGEWSKEEDQFVLGNYPPSVKGRTRLDAKELDVVERMCYRLKRTPRAIRQRVWTLQKLERMRAGKE